MYGELTEKDAVERVDRSLDHHLADQFEILLYKKNRTYETPLLSYTQTITLYRHSSHYCVEIQTSWINKRSMFLKRITLRGPAGYI